jgi:hypothetical protein
MRESVRNLVGASPERHHWVQFDLVHGPTSHPRSGRTPQQAANHQETRELVQNVVVAFHEPPTSIMFRLASQGQGCQLSPDAGPGMRMSEPSQGRSRDDPPNHQDCAQTSQISGVRNNRPRLQASEPPTIYPNGVRAAAGADPACHACIDTSTCV